IALKPDVTPRRIRVAIDVLRIIGDTPQPTKASIDEVAQRGRQRVQAARRLSLERVDDEARDLRAMFDLGQPEPEGDQLVVELLWLSREPHGHGLGISNGELTDVTPTRPVHDRRERVELLDLTQQANS